MIAQELEVALHKAFVQARDKRHEAITVEHLLLALLDTPTSAAILQGCGANVEFLRTQLVKTIDQHTALAAADRDVDTQPTLGFQRVIQRAILHVQSAGKKEVDGAEVLMAVFGEKDSHAVRLLERSSVTGYAAASFLSHGRPKVPEIGDATELQVVLYNDSFTPMQFVVAVLGQFFGMNEEDAREAMLEVHRQGATVCGLYERDVARDLVEQVNRHARENGHPLRCGLALPKK